jgi:redox-sensing transcriptional repressor
MGNGSGWSRRYRSAIARYQGFANRGFKVTMLFDNDPQIIGQKIGPFTVQDITDLEESIRQAGIIIAMIATPSAAAQGVADQLRQEG